MHVMGEKTWTVFEGRAEYPIKHPSFEGWPRERHDQLQGEVWREVRLRPGDLLYLPRGQYHYALADDGPCVHIAWGVTYPIGMDVGQLRVRADGRRGGRPRQPAAGSGRAAGAAGRDRPGLWHRPWPTRRRSTTCCGLCAALPWPRERYDLPGLIERAEEAYRVKGAGLRLVSQGGRHGLVKEGTRQAVEVPAAMQPYVAWVLARDRFTRRELAAAFPAAKPATLDQLIVDLGRMALVEPTG